MLRPLKKETCMTYQEMRLYPNLLRCYPSQKVMNVPHECSSIPREQGNQKITDN